MLDFISLKDSTGRWNELFSDEELDQILNVCLDLPREPAHVGTERSDETINSPVRKSEVGWLNRNVDNEWIFSRYDGAVQRMNSALFGIDIYPLNQLQFTVYNEDGGHYEWHWDMKYAPEPNAPLIERQRKLSVVTQLSDPEDYEGGVLQVGPCGRIFDIDKEKGLTYMFTSFVNHRVTPVTSGTRYSLVGWFEGPDWR